MFRKFLLWAGMLSVVLISFAVTVLLGELYYSRPKTLSEEKAILIDGLRDYKRVRGSYPVLPDHPVSDLKSELVRAQRIRPDGGPEPDVDARYVSFDGKSYGLLFHTERTATIPLGKPCVVEVDTTAPTGWWGTPPNCPF